MFDVFISSLFQVLQWPTIGFMLLGAFVGFWVGILPGLGGSVTLALMMAFVFTMEPVNAFAFLLGMHSVCATTGDITSVLFAVPGEATSAATVMDGYPMTKKGQAGRALGAVLMSSLVGAWIGALILALMVPVIRPVVLSFGSPEFLVLAVLGLSFVAVLSTKSMTKGLLMGGLGFSLAMIGADTNSGITRYVFGQLYLWEGINIVPVTVGIFAIPEILELMFTRGSIAHATKEAKVQWSGIVQGILDTFRWWWLTIRCSIIGTFMGFIPGMGGSVSQWIAYAHAQQTSKHPEEFGKGSIEGVLAVGAVNNAKEGGTLVPTLAFGIPAGSAMAILLGAFLIVGITPGPPMLNEHLNITYSMVWVIVLSNVIAVVGSLAVLKHLAALTFMKGTLLVPFLIALVAIGAFTANNSLFDLVLMLVIGAVGVVAKRYDWPRAPLVLALVLGQITERNLWISYQLSGLEWLSRPSVLVILGITIAGLVLPHYLARRRQAAHLAAAHSSGGM